MDLLNIVIAIGVFAGIWYVISTIMIYENLRKRNMKVNFLLLRFLAPKYAHQYKKVTSKETGKVGSLFYHWIISVNIALVAFVMLIVVK
jgi:hypothetical protein